MIKNLLVIILVLIVIGLFSYIIFFQHKVVPVKENGSHLTSSKFFGIDGSQDNLGIKFLSNSDKFGTYSSAIVTGKLSEVNFLAGQVVFKVQTVRNTHSEELTVQSGPGSYLTGFDDFGEGGTHYNVPSDKLYDLLKNNIGRNTQFEVITEFSKSYIYTVTSVPDSCNLICSTRLAILIKNVVTNSKLSGSGNIDGQIGPVLTVYLSK